MASYNPHSQNNGGSCFLRWHRETLNNPESNTVRMKEHRLPQPYFTVPHLESRDTGTVSSRVNISQIGDPVITLRVPELLHSELLCARYWCNYCSFYWCRNCAQWSQSEGKSYTSVFPTHSELMHTLTSQMILLAWLPQCTLGLRQQWTGWAGQELFLWLPFLGSLSQPRKTVSLSCTLDSRKERGGRDTRERMRRQR